MAAGLYAPTSEEHFDDDLPVHGDMPASMNGVYVRVGPVRLKIDDEVVEHCAFLILAWQLQQRPRPCLQNPYHRPTGNYHW
jgi:Retinal pigment epithelial membrane protein